jgi:hypothetical protein
MRKKLLRVVLPVVVAGSLLVGVGVESASAEMAPRPTQTIYHYGNHVGPVFYKNGLAQRKIWQQVCKKRYDTYGNSKTTCGSWHVVVSILGPSGR